MSGLSPRASGRLSRRQREERAYRLVVVGGVAAVVAVIGVVLAALGVVGDGVPLLAIVVAAICGLLFRRTASGR
jgi:putative flippase GtrA